MKHYDLVVVGSGAGLMVLEAALGAGMRCALVENSKLGGTCLNRGCIPSKMLVYPADLIREAGRAGQVNLSFGSPVIDWRGLSERIWKQIDFNKRIESSLAKTEGLTLYKGTGRFIGRDTMQVEYSDGTVSEGFNAKRYVIAAGARTLVPAVEGLTETGFITSETFFGDRYPEKPYKSLIIIGGGAIGTEFAHIFSAMGTRVTIVDMKARLLSTEEEEISAFVEKQFKSVGIVTEKNAVIVGAEKDEERKIVSVEDAVTGERRKLESEEIFVASGLRSNADSLGLEAAGIASDSRGWITTNEYLETSVKNIYAIGDINGKFQFRHKANQEAEILIHNLFLKTQPRKRACYDAVPWAIYTWPQVAHVGLTEKEAQSRGLRTMAGTNHYSEVAGGFSMGYERGGADDGFVKIIIGEDRRIIGVHIAGPYAAMLLQPFVYLMNCGHTCEDAGAGRLFGKNSRILRELRHVCPGSGSYLPINDSMVIHPSMNELTAWAFEKIETID